MAESTRSCVPLLLLVGLACGDSGGASGTSAGQEGNPCLMGQCFGDLVCRENVCVDPPDGSTGATPTTTTDVTPTTTSGDPSTVTTEPDDTSSTGDDTTGGPPVVCGDGQLGAGEGCDDGNNVNGDGCNQDCALPGEAQWVRHVDEGEGNEGISVAVDGQNNVIVGGRSTPDNASTGGAFIGKWSPGGDLLWSNSYQGPDVSASTLAVTATADGSIYAGGWEPIAMDSPSLAWLRALGPDGAEKWRVDHQSPTGSSAIRGVAVADNGDIVVGGYTFGETTFNDVWIRRYTAAGQAVWTAGYDSPEMNDQDEVWDLALAPNGDVVVSGRTTTAAYSDYLTQRYSGAGALLWTQTFDRKMNDDIAAGVAVDAQGDVLAIGDPYFNFINVIRYAPDGTQKGIYSDMGVANAGVFDGAGNLYLAGRNLDSDLLLRIVSPEGTTLWEWTYDEGTIENAQDVALDAYGNIIMTGVLGVNFVDLIVIKLAPP